MRGARIPQALLVAALLTGTAHARAGDAPVAAPIAQAIADQAGGAIKRFYRTRHFQPLWITNGRLGPQADTLLGDLRTAGLDGLKPGDYDIDGLSRRIDAARSGNPEALARAEIALSKAFARYVRDQRRPDRNVRITYADKKLRPHDLKPEEVLRAASFPSSFADYVADMGWMSDHYAALRKAMAATQDDAARARLSLNLDRARILPSPWVRHIEVDASSGELYWYEAGKRAGTMRVVVGAKQTQTPMLVGQIQWAIVNPYWNVPDYLTRDSIAKKVLGGRSLATMHMQALSGWSSDAAVLPANAIDWHAVAQGSETPRIRQLPGPFNSMGRVKFLFPNKLGIYLHDTPERDLLAKDDRHFSNGCIRLDKALVLGKWLLGRPVGDAGGKPETPEMLPVPVPVYLTYLTAQPSRHGVTFRPDIYGRDGTADRG